LVPRELSSGESQRRGRITKAGSSRVRSLLVQAAVSILRLRDPRTADLRAWTLGIAARRGKKVAVVALARRLAGILYAMLRDGTGYQPRHQRRPPPHRTAASTAAAPA
jgi:transposase